MQWRRVGAAALEQRPTRKYRAWAIRPNRLRVAALPRPATMPSLGLQSWASDCSIQRRGKDYAKSFIRWPRIRPGFARFRR